MIHKLKRPEWDEQHLMAAIVASLRTSCLIRGVGAAIVKKHRVLATGYNGAPAGIKSCLELGYCYYQDLAYQDSLKNLGSFEDLKEMRKGFCNAIHAERNAFRQCTRHRVRPDGGTLYITNFPCPGCVRDEIIPHEISEVVVWKGYLSNPLLTKDEERVSMEWLDEARIPLRYMELPDSRIDEYALLMKSVGERLEYKYQPGIIPVKPV